jgi:hypothetical protein
LRSLDLVTSMEFSTVGLEGLPVGFLGVIRCYKVALLYICFMMKGIPVESIVSFNLGNFLSKIPYNFLRDYIKSRFSGVNIP